MSSTKNSFKCSPQDFLYVSAVAILFALLAVLVWQALSISFGQTISKWAMPVCMVAALAVALILTRNLRSWLWMLAYMIVTAVISVLIVDSSFDGQCYHQEIVACLMDGWNPLTVRESEQMTDWCLHYPKALEILEASIALPLNRIEGGKWVNFLLLYVTFALSVQLLRTVGVSRRTWLWASLVTLNPIVICQLPTFYIDYAVYCYMVIAIALSFKVAATKGRSSLHAYAALATVTILAIGTKLNSFFYVGLVLICVIAWLAYQKRWRPAFGITGMGIISLMIGGIIFFHPYITNLQLGHHIFYPLMGEGAIDIMTVNTPEMYKALDNRIVNFLISIFYPALPSTDARSGAFGIGFGVVFLIALVLFVKQWRSIPLLARYVGCLLLCSLFIFSQSWCGRYVPQTWLFPILVMVFCRVRFPKWTKTMIILYAICILSCFPRLGRSIQYTQRQNIFYSSLKQPVEIIGLSSQDKRKLEENGIKYNIVKEFGPTTVPVAWISGIKEAGLTVEDYQRLNENTPGWLGVGWEVE